MNDTPKTTEDVLLERSVRDWRVAEQADQDLTDLQKQPWIFKVVLGGYDGLHIEAQAPDGTRRQVTLEVSNGNLHAIVGGVGDDNHATVQIGAEATVVVPMTPAPGRYMDAMRFDENGMSAHKGDIEAGCTSEAPKP